MIWYEKRNFNRCKQPRFLDTVATSLLICDRNDKVESIEISNYLNTSTLFIKEIPILIAWSYTHLTDFELLPKTTNSDFSRLGISQLPWNQEFTFRATVSRDNRRSSAISSGLFLRGLLNKGLVIINICSFT